MDSIPIDFTLERNRLESPMLWGSSGAEIESFTIGHFLYHETYEPKPSSTSLHSHEKIYELSVMRNGEMEYKIGDKRISISAENGDFIFIPPGVKHIRRCFEKGARINGFQFELLARKASRLQNERFEKSIVKNNYHFKGCEEVRQIQKLFNEELESQRPLRRFMAELRMKELLAAMLRTAMPGIFKEDVERGSGRGKEAFTKLINAYIEEHLTGEINTAELAKLCNLSLRHLNRLFQKSFSTTIGQHIRNQRLEMALAELETGDKTVKEIAYATGYSDTSHFIELFRRKYGKTPQKYRENL
jgi:AraC-like DNA-binding protein